MTPGERAGWRILALLVSLNLWLWAIVFLIRL